jgi:hypothetical protein
MTETNTPPIVSQQAQTLLRDQISTLTDNAINEMQRVYKRAGREPVYALLVLGAAMIIFALAFKVQFFGQADIAVLDMRFCLYKTHSRIS